MQDIEKDEEAKSKRLVKVILIVFSIVELIVMIAFFLNRRIA